VKEPVESPVKIHQQTIDATPAEESVAMESVQTPPTRSQDQTVDKPAALASGNIEDIKHDETKVKPPQEMPDKAEKDANTPKGGEQPKAPGEVTTSLTKPAKAGDMKLEVASNSGFAVGDTIKIDDELNYIAGFGSIILKTPLTQDHGDGTIIMKLQLADCEDTTRTQGKAQKSPIAGTRKDAEPSDWDDEDAKPCVDVALPEQTAIAGMRPDATPSGWDDDEEVKPATSGDGATQKMESVPKEEARRRVPKGPLGPLASLSGSVPPIIKPAEVPSSGQQQGTEPSSWDDEDEAKKGATHESESNSGEAKPEPKGGVALEFDMFDGPKKQVPKKLADRLSQKHSSKKSKKKEDNVAEPSGFDSDDNKTEDKKTSSAPVMANSKKSKSSKRSKFDCGGETRAKVLGAEKPALGVGANTGNELSDMLTDALLGPSVPLPAPAAKAPKHALMPNLHCIGCDHEVLRIDDHAWSGEVPYMTLRNHYPNAMKLRPILAAKQGQCAYCCQCSSKSAESSSDLTEVASGLRWKVIDA